VKTRTWYLLGATCPSTFIGGSDLETMSLSRDHSTLPLALQPVWNVVEQISDAGPDYGSVSEYAIASGLTLHEAQRRLAEMTDGCAT
jgi:hypothetical protein